MKKKNLRQRTIKQDNNRIIILTTKGCEACEIMIRIMAKVISDNNIKVYFETYDFNDEIVKEKYPCIEDITINDFPAAVLLRGGIDEPPYNVCYWTGTRSAKEVLTCLKQWKYV